jgi:hypothetical protein
MSEKERLFSLSFQNRYASDGTPIRNRVMILNLFQAHQGRGFLFSIFNYLIESINEFSD